MEARSTLLINYHLFIKVSMFSGTRGVYRAKNVFRRSSIIKMYNFMSFIVVSNMYLYSIGKSRSGAFHFIKMLKTNMLGGTRIFVY